MRPRHIIATAALLASFAASSLAAGDQNQFDGGRNGISPALPGCQPGIELAVLHNFEYRELYSVLALNQRSLKSLLSAVANPATYQALLTKAEAVAASLPGGRLLVTLPDGTVVVDTAAKDDLSNVLPMGNSYAHFVAKTVNENHNTRVAILSTQLYPCGLGVERKLSTSTGVTESYVAIRLGEHLDSVGTARLSSAQ